jgi:hypothetical protein
MESSSICSLLKIYDLFVLCFSQAGGKVATIQHKDLGVAELGRLQDASP